MGDLTPIVQVCDQRCIPASRVHSMPEDNGTRNGGPPDVEPQAGDKAQKSRKPKTERRKSFELALERRSSQELMQSHPEGQKEIKNGYQVSALAVF